MDNLPQLINAESLFYSLLGYIKSSQQECQAVESILKILLYLQKYVSNKQDLSDFIESSIASLKIDTSTFLSTSQFNGVIAYYSILDEEHALPFQTLLKCYSL